MPLHAAPDQTLDPYSLGMASGTNSVYEAYFNAPSVAKSNPLAGRNVTTFNMDEAYDGQALGLRDTVTDWMWTANQTWYTEIALPWRVVDDIFVEWNKWEANAHILGHTPHQATSRLISQRRNTYRVSLVRRGIAMQIEHDWAKTRLGRESIMIGIGQFADSYQETANFEVIRALLHAHVYNQQYVRDNGMVRRLDHIEYLKKQRDNFAKCQKQKNGLDLWDEETDALAHQYRGQFDTVIVPDRMLSYVTMVRPEKTDYYIRGPDGPSSIDSKLQGAGSRVADRLSPQRTLNNKNVFQARAYHVEGVQPVELLAKETQIGEYNWMTDEHCIYNEGYRSDHRDIMIYDEDKDRYSKLSLRQALTYCGLFDMEGNLKSALPPDAVDYNDEDIKRDFLMRWDPRAQKYTPVEFFGDIGNLFLTTECIEKVAKTMAAKSKFAAPNYGGILTAQQARAAANPDNYAFVDTKTNLFYGTTNINSLLLGNLVPVRKGSGGAAGGVRMVNPEPEMGTHLDKFLKMAKSIVRTDTAKSTIHDMYKTSKSKPEFAERLGEFLSREAVGANAEFATEDLFDNWYTQRARGQLVNNPNITIGNDMMPEGRMDTGDLMYALPGKDLPEGHEYVNPGDAHYVSDGIVPQSIEHVLQMQQAIASDTGKKQQYQQEEYMYEEPMQQGRGFHSNVGTMMSFGTEGQGLEAMKTTWNEGASPIFTSAAADPARYNMINAHFDNIRNSSMSDSEKYYAMLFLGCRVTRDQLQRFITHNIAFPINFLILRPHATYRGRTAIKLLANGGTGNMYFGHGSAEIGHDASRMISVMHSVAYMAAVVNHPENVWAEQNLFVDRYFGGLGMQFYTPESYQQRRPNGGNVASIICCAVPCAEKDFPVPLDIAGRYYTDYENGLIDLRQNSELHYSTAFRYDSMYNLFAKTNAADEINIPTVLPDEAHHNRVCWPGAQYMKNPQSGTFDFYEYSQGPWGELVYPGSGKVRAGTDSYLDPARMNNISKVM